MTIAVVSHKVRIDLRAATFKTLPLGSEMISEALSILSTLPDAMPKSSLVVIN